MNAGKLVASALLPAALILSGCSSHPISSELREQARPITFNQVRFDPEGTRGSVVIWGGRIVGVANNTNGGSIYILASPLRGGGKPRSGEPSPGRFMAVSPGFLDPEMFPTGRRVTVAGPLNGVWTEPMEEDSGPYSDSEMMNYTYPVVQIQQVHLWHPDSQPPPGTITTRSSGGPRVNVVVGPSPMWVAPPPSPLWWYYPMPMYRPMIYQPGFRGSFHVNAGVRVGPRPPPPARRRGRW